MKTRNIIAIAAAAGVSALLSGATTAATIEVNQQNIGASGWEFKTFDNVGNVPNADPAYQGTLVAGPATPPLGAGSARLQTGVDGGGAVKLQTANFNGTKLSQITQLQYSTYVTTNNGGTPANNAQAPYLQIALDRDNDNVADDALFFEPVYQTGTYLPTAAPSVVIPDQRGGDGNAPNIGTWETYDALAGGWWSNNGDDGAGSGGPPLTSLAHYMATYPDATIVSTASGGGFRVVAGFGGPTDWGQFDGNVDAIAFNGTTYNFEVPEPASLGLLALGGMILGRRSRRNKATA
jgi:hypothetical protein